MRVVNVKEIFDNDEFVSIVTKSGTVIHLPRNSEHSIVVEDIRDPSDHYIVTVNVDLYQ